MSSLFSQNNVIDESISERQIKNIMRNSRHLIPKYTLNLHQLLLPDEIPTISRVELLERQIALNTNIQRQREFAKAYGIPMLFGTNYSLQQRMMKIPNVFVASTGC
jgi:hypothetical protein